MQIIPINRISPEWITRLQPGDCYVFGANEAGIHETGAALFAKANGAIRGQGYGPMGQTFGIPTKPRDLRVSLPLNRIQTYVDGYIDYAIIHPQTRFLTTKIGCLRAGYTPADIAPLFKRALPVANICLPPGLLGDFAVGRNRRKNA